VTHPRQQLFAARCACGAMYEAYAPRSGFGDLEAGFRGRHKGEGCAVTLLDEDVARASIAGPAPWRRRTPRFRAR